MCKSLALISGKGGSGKTTIALSMASLLSECNLKVLLVDCDLITNGATCFFEDRLNENDIESISFYKILAGSKKYNERGRVIRINSFLDFIPSVSKINEDLLLFYAKEYNQKVRNNFELFYKSISKKYDIILFDCQAGYTDYFECILKNADQCLVVMECDSFSSSAIRSTYLKIKKLIGNKKIYQIFNKVNVQDLLICSKFSKNSLFISLDSLENDAKIGAGFETLDLSKLTSASRTFNRKILNVCEKIFEENSIIISKILNGKKDLEILRVKLNNDRKKVTNNIRNVAIMSLCIIIISTAIFILYGMLDLDNKLYLILSTILSLLITILSVFITSSMIKYRSKTKKKILELETFIEEFKKIEEKLPLVKKDNLNLRPRKFNRLTEFNKTMKIYRTLDFNYLEKSRSNLNKLSYNIDKLDDNTINELKFDLARDRFANIVKNNEVLFYPGISNSEGEYLDVKDNMLNELKYDLSKISSRRGVIVVFYNEKNVKQSSEDLENSVNVIRESIQNKRLELIQNKRTDNYLENLERKQKNYVKSDAILEK